MEEGLGKEGKCLVLHTEQSRSDLVSIFAYNLLTYGDDHASAFISFLEDQMQALAESPLIGAVVERPEGVRLHIVKRRARKQAHGYRVFYKLVPNGIELIRILHSATDSASILGLD